MFPGNCPACIHNEQLQCIVDPYSRIYKVEKLKEELCMYICSEKAPKAKAVQLDDSNVDYCVLRMLA